MPCVPYQRLHCLMRELYRQCGWKLLRGPPSSSGLLFTDHSHILYDLLNNLLWFSNLFSFGVSDVHGSASTKGNIPLQDQHLALAILLELAVQRGTLRLPVYPFIPADVSIVLSPRS